MDAWLRLTATGAEPLRASQHTQHTNTHTHTGTHKYNSFITSRKKTEVSSIHYSLKASATDFLSIVE